LHSRGWISQRSTKAGDEGYKLSVKQFNRIKSNNSLKLDAKTLKSTNSYKSIGSKALVDSKSAVKNGSLKRNKSYESYSKKKNKTQKASKEKEYTRIKEYIHAKSLQNKSQSARTSDSYVRNFSKEENQQKLKEEFKTKLDTKSMVKKKLSIEIPDTTSEEIQAQILKGNILPKDLGPHRSVSVQNRTTTITQFSSLTPNEEEQPLNFVPTKIEEHIPLKSGKDIIVPNFESTKTSVKRNGVVSAYAANTHQGIVRNYNEDRVSIILNIVKPPSRKNENWPK
jgi:hypothetical protein